MHEFCRTAERLVLAASEPSGSASIRLAMATIVSRSALADHLSLIAIPLEGLSLQRTPGLLWPEGQVRTPMTAAFAAIVRRVAKSMAEN